MTDLSLAVEEYLTIRRALGYKLESHGRLLADFVGYLEAIGADTVTAEHAVAWAKQPNDASPGRWSARLTVIRGFATYLQALDPSTEVPAAGLLPDVNHRAVPYLYSQADIVELLQAAGRLRSPLRAATYKTLIGLMAVTGMRVGEAVGLDRDDIDWDQALVTIRKAKFGKSREVPLHATTVEALRSYVRRRDQLCPRPKAPSFFVSNAGTRLVGGTVGRDFSGLACAAGLQPRSERCRPRTHDLRHSFAVRTLVDWYGAGVDVQVKLPLLSTFLGHVGPKSTYWYLSGSPELFGLVCERLERAGGERP
jgi:integrase/recombinase XerD